MSLSQLRPLEFGEILDGAFVLYRRHLRTFAAVVMVVHLPVLVLAAASPMLRTWVGLRVVNQAEAVLACLAWGAGSAACSVAASDAYLEGDASAPRALRAIGTRLPAMGGAYVLKLVALVGGVVLFVAPSLFALQETFAVSAAVMLEGAGPLRALRRSSALAAGARLHVLAVALAFGFLMWLPMYTVSYPVTHYWHETGLRWTAYSAAFVAVVMTLMRAFILPLGSIGAVVLYYDRRVRTEAIDLARPDAAPAFAVAV